MCFSLQIIDKAHDGCRQLHLYCIIGLRTQTFEREWCRAGWSGAWEAKKTPNSHTENTKTPPKIVDVLTF